MAMDAAAPGAVERCGAATERPGNRRPPLFEGRHTSTVAAAGGLVECARTTLLPHTVTTDVLTPATGVALAAGTDTDNAHRLLTLLRTGSTPGERPIDARRLSKIAAPRIFGAYEFSARPHRRRARPRVS